MPEEDTWLSIADAARRTGTSVWTVRRRIADGSLPASRVGRGRLIRIRASHVDALMRRIPSAGGAV